MSFINFKNTDFVKYVFMFVVGSQNQHIVY